MPLFTREVKCKVAYKNIWCAKIFDNIVLKCGNKSDTLAHDKENIKMVVLYSVRKKFEKKQVFILNLKDVKW